VQQVGTGCRQLRGIDVEWLGRGGGNGAANRGGSTSGGWGGGGGEGATNRSTTWTDCIPKPGYSLAKKN
jgi:hypothetical protein